MSWKRKLAAGTSLAALSAVTLHMINKFIYFSATIDNLLSNPSGTYYDWKFGKVYYTKHGNGKPLLLIHDLTTHSSAYEWNKISKELAKNYTVYSLDLPGCGRSEKSNITYTNYLFVQLVDDFIKHVIGEKAKVIATGESGSFVIGACQNNPSIIGDIILVNPTDIRRLTRIPGKRSKMLTWIINTPILGTFIYNIAAKQKSIEILFKEKYFYNTDKVTNEMVRTCYESAHSGGASSKYLFASLVGHYTTINIKHCLKSINNSIFILIGDGDPSYRETAEEYQELLPSIEIADVKETKYLPQLENPEAFMEQINILFAEEEPL